MKRGDIVQDTETDRTDEMVVILTPEADCTDWDVGEDNQYTVAEKNPDYADDQPVIITSFKDSLEEKVENWNSIDKGELFDKVTDNSIRFYAFPKNRLEKTGLTSNFNTLEEYKKVVRRKLGSEFKSQTWTLEEPNEVDGVKVKGVKADQSKVIFWTKQGNKLTKRFSNTEKQEVTE
jgi:hypothetical protein